MINRVGAARPGLLAVGVGLGLLSSCGPTASTSPRIVAIAPEQGFVDTPLLLRIDVPDLRPSLRVNVDQGTLVADLSSVRMTLFDQSDQAIALDLKFWDKKEFFWAPAPANLPAGPYTLRVEDPRGQHRDLPNAFRSLGPDTTAPSIKLMPELLPNSILGEDTTITATITADDGQGWLEQVHWETTDGTKDDCPPPPDKGASPELPQSTVTCRVKFTIGAFADDSPSTLPFGFHAWARDVAGNVAALDIPLRIGRRPTVVSFTETVGALGGYQPFLVRGRGFVPGSQAKVDGIPIVGDVPGGTVTSDSLIVGWTPPRNRAGGVHVQVVSPAGTGIAPSLFTYVLPPRPRDVEPTHGARTGGFRVTLLGNDLRTNAKVFIGPDLNTRLLVSPVRHDSDNKLSFCVPPGSGKVSIWVYDSITGDGVLANAFTYDDGSADAGTSPPDPSCK